MAIEAERAKGAAVLVLDAGNALFKFPNSTGDKNEKARAELLLKQMDAMGTVAMAVGARDLTLGLNFLRNGAKGAKMKLLSANLVDKEGKPVFPASTVATVGGLKIGVVGASPEGTLPESKGLPVGPAVLAEARRLREKEKVDVVVLLAAVPYEVTRRLASQAEGVDFVMQSHEGRGPGVAYRDGLATMVPPGERGRQVARLELAVSGPGTFQDLATAGQAKESLKNLEANLKRAKERLAATKDEAARKALEETVASFEARRAALQKDAKLDATGMARTHQLSYIQLGADKPSDPAVQKLVERIEPPGSSDHGHPH
ncbi:bifunctional UDP-sugar hydrolase/5'-nucleotidase [Hyalangium gracile]|uniref:5'-nucleotidase n=1 Tax=Hyalangium gracile TaxID=394092 RepID=UPI001CCFD934|nr:5'-nucleotidase [Hyalangium gracile]